MSSQPNLNQMDAELKQAATDPIPAEYITAIGKVCVRWGALESVVDLVIAKLAAFDLMDLRGAIITAHMTWPLKMDVLASLVDALRPDYPHLAIFDVAQPLLKKAQEGRNKTVHGQWGQKDGHVVKLRMTARGKLKTSLDPVTIEEIEDIALDIYKAAAVVTRLVTNG